MSLISFGDSIDWIVEYQLTVYYRNNYKNNFNNVKLIMCGIA